MLTEHFVIFLELVGKNTKDIKRIVRKSNFSLREVSFQKLLNALLLIKF